MKNRILYFVLTIIIALILPSCKNDLNVLAPGEESVSVYGVLNPNEPVQKIRINKIFLTSGDAVAAGQDFNTINYDTSELKVSLQRFINGSTTPTLTTVGNFSKKEIVLTGTLVTTASGSFNPNQWIWQTSDKLYSSGEYKLTILIKNSGREITSKTNMIDSTKSYASKPFITHPTLYPPHGSYSVTGCCPTPQSGYIDYSVVTVTQKIKFKSIANAKLYDVVMRFHYIDSLISGGANQEFVDYNFTTQKSTTLLGNEEMEVSFLADDFYTNVASEIGKKPVVSVKNRRAFYIEYIIRSSNDDMNTFLLVNQPSHTIAQDKPFYTNISGGVGIFASGARSIITHDLWTNFIDKIACHASTNPFGFCNSIGVKTGVCP